MARIHCPTLFTLFLFFITMLVQTSFSQEDDFNITSPVLVTGCRVPGTVALTFDDGPFIYTAELLEVLNEFSARSTFFVNGHHFAITEYDDILQRMVAEGHQVGSHTYGHAYLPALDYASIAHQMQAMEPLFQQKLGKIPTYMRPPYLAFNDVVLTVMEDLGYRVVSADIDTKDYENDSPALIEHSFDNFVAGIESGGSIVLCHDTHQQTVAVLVRAMLESLAIRGLTAVPVGECLGEDESMWYR